MMRRQSCHAERVMMLDGERGRARLREPRGHQSGRIARQLQPPDGKLDCDLPCAGRGQEEVSVRRREEPATLRLQELRLGEQPEPAVSVQEYPQALTLKLRENLLGQGIGEVGGNDKLSLLRAENAFARRRGYGHQTSYRVPCLGDDHIFSGCYALE